MVIFYKKFFVFGLLILSYSCKEKNLDLESEGESEVEAFKISDKASAVKQIKKYKLYTSALSAVNGYTAGTPGLNKFISNDTKRPHKIASLLLAVHNQEAALKVISKGKTNCYAGIVSAEYKISGWGDNCKGAFKAVLYALDKKAAISSSIKNTLLNYNGHPVNKGPYSENAYKFYEYFANLKATDLQ